MVFLMQEKSVSKFCTKIAKLYDWLHIIFPTNGVKVCFLEWSVTAKDVFTVSCHLILTNTVAWYIVLSVNCSVHDLVVVLTQCSYTDSWFKHINGILSYNCQNMKRYTWQHFLFQMFVFISQLRQKTLNVV